ncbi:hypothetical protein VINI7043_21056 [Vibrio nigripulchritudo ATCC 27043]|uniref:hypothetical protein n=1 Tax=Vibrio nigripulchritudo TaxID=28173 RepID=UPI00021C230C|nr:hypothetical protein [Vibrio nigripulchritudo]EGU56399.1 hypothetical protein VINI7043_21056 [Vibrio nigripulchritudo ATCC 27043]
MDLFNKNHQKGSVFLLLVLVGISTFGVAVLYASKNPLIVDVNSPTPTVKSEEKKNDAELILSNDVSFPSPILELQHLVVNQEEEVSDILPLLRSEFEEYDTPPPENIKRLKQKILEYKAQLETVSGN